MEFCIGREEKVCEGMRDVCDDGGAPGGGLVEFGGVKDHVGGLLL